MSYSDRPNAVVLLSAYNGEKYIKAQIESILRQTFTDFELLVRDDGSDDSTKQIVKELAKTDSRIRFISDDNKGNLGYPKCFYALTDMAPDADFYFFSDQDDIWFEDKIERAVDMLSKLPSDVPAAYYGGYTICDEELKPVRNARPAHTPPKNKSSDLPVCSISLKDTIFEVCGLEFTMAVNRSALELLNNNKPSFCTGRGTWMSMLYSVYANIVCDERPCAFYRRHQSAVTASNQSFLGLWLWRIKYLLLGGGFADFHDIIKDFYLTMGGKLDIKNRRMLRLFADDRYFPGVITKVFYPRRLRSRILDELALRFAFLTGRI